jgi:acyl-[acyl-carrier-protein]-phospholipid O-acyltransferase/long-chain-fatty-acid--[acyl-carrier-protein] ligase
VLNAIIAVIGAALVAWAVTALRQKSVTGLTYVQALGYALFRFLFGARFVGFETESDTSGPTAYILPAQSRLDKWLLKSYLPIGTFHLNPMRDREQIRTLIKSVFAGRGQVCLYMPPEVEAKPETMAMLADIGRLLRESTARVVPIHVRGSRMSLYSYWSRQKAPRSLLPQITVAAAPSQSMATVSDRMLGDSLLDGMMSAKFRSTNLSQTLHEAIVTSARIFGPSREIAQDALGSKLSYRQMLIGARALATRFQRIAERGKPVGVLLPNSNSVVLAIFALFSSGRPAALLNYTAGSAAVVSAINTAGIRAVVCARGFVDKADLQPLVDAIVANGTSILYVEDVRASLTFKEKAKAWLLWRKPVVKTNADDAAVILFTSGSEGAPKAVVLSSRNLIANASQADCRVDISPADSLFNVLPVFHSFGLLGGTLLPLLYGIHLFLYPSPLHYKIIPSVARRVAPTVMFGTDTFLMGYGRAARDGDFDSLRMIVAGAEAVKPETRKMYTERFGAAIVEGYGMTEAAPVVAVNSATFAKDGSVGKLLPGMEMKLEPVDGIEDGGRFFVAGPNVMMGYMLADKPGVLQSLADKWHDSGDIVAIDERGFLTIKGRAKRFAKIAGEMVSLGAVELMVQKLWPQANHAAIAVPDKRKGERIVLLTTQARPMKEELLTYSRRYGATELMVPHDIVNVDTIPVLASGKVDYGAAARMVTAQVSL